MVVILKMNIYVVKIVKLFLPCSHGHVGVMLWDWVLIGWPPSTQLQLLFELPLLLLLNQKCFWLWLWFSHSSSSVPELPDQHLRLRVHWHRARVCRDGKPTAQCSLDEERRGSDSQWLFPDRSEWRLNWESSFGVVIIINILYYFYISYLITRSVLHSLPVLTLPHSSLITSRVRLCSNVVCCHGLSPGWQQPADPGFGEVRRRVLPVPGRELSRKRSGYGSAPAPRTRYKHTNGPFFPDCL